MADLSEAQKAAASDDAYEEITARIGRIEALWRRVNKETETDATHKAFPKNEQVTKLKPRSNHNGNEPDPTITQ